jgi:tetratricopeptide (TPR) repeat protein
VALAPEPVRSRYWQGIVSPEHARAEQLVRHGRALLYPALGLGLLLGNEVALQRRIAVESALARFERAVELAPDLREARLFYGKALAFWEHRDDDGQLRSRADEAVQQLHALRALDPLYEAQEVAFQLGVLHSRQGDFAAAVREYERSLALDSDGDDNGTLLGNLAEVTMLRGDLPRALALYERAARVSEEGGRVLSLWGVAVALDRLGERKAALEQARRAMQQDRAPLAVLRQNGVFFVPAYERSYYEALGALALADAVREPGEQLSTLAARGASWLSVPESLSTLTLFERALAELSDTPHAALVAPLSLRVTRAQRELSKLALRGPPTHNTSARVEPTTRPAGEPLPQAREAVCLLWLLRSLAGFASYVQQDGGKGPFADDAREHLVDLSHALSRP